jgi:uncharacterized protein (TIGR03083 family)
MTVGPARLRPRVDVELLERALGFTRGVLAGVRDDEGPLPTPCADWCVTDLLTHMVDSLEVVTELGLGRLAVAGPPPASRRPEVLADHLRVLGCVLLDGWIGRAAAAPVRGEPAPGDGSTRPAATARVPADGVRLDLRVAAGAGALEVAVHGWDLARARGLTDPLPPLLAAALLPVAVRLVPVIGRSQRFAPPAPPPATDPASLLLAHLGRDAAWASTARRG